MKARSAVKCKPLAERFWPKVDKRGPDECWPWLAALHEYGYGMISVGGKKGGMRRAHRIAYELEVGPIPEGLDLDHLCRNRRCVNPAHLEPVTRRENLVRGEGFVGVHARKTHCPQGHPYDGENLYVNDRGHRQCRTCQRQYNRESYYRRIAA